MVCLMLCTLYQPELKKQEGGDAFPCSGCLFLSFVSLSLELSVPKNRSHRALHFQTADCKYWRVPNPPVANPRVAERAP